MKSKPPFSAATKSHAPVVPLLALVDLFFVSSLSFLSTLSAVAQSQDFLYTTNNGTITITRSTGVAAEVTIPATIYGMPVTAIGNYAFSRDYVVTSVSIPDSVRSIGDYAFSQCDILTNVTLGTNVASIGNLAFARSFNLVSALIPSSATNIGGYPFGLCLSLPAITVDPANSAYSSVDGVLLDKTQTTLIEYPGGRVGAFVIPASVATILDSAFYGCTNLSGVTIPSGVSSIGDSAFYGCTNLIGATIAYGVSSIGNWAFEFCNSLTNITIPSTATNIGTGAFDECSSLTAINVAPANAFYASRDGVLLDKFQTTLIQYPCGLTGSYAVPASITNVVPGAFNAASVTSVSISNGVISIGASAFSSCSSLTNVTLACGAGSIGNYAFQGCTGLPKITIPDCITNLGYDAFGDCANLTSAVIGEGITNFGSYAFQGCTNLATVYFRGNAPTADATVFLLDSPIFYYLPGTTGWGTIFGGSSLALWLPRIQLTGSSFGVQSNQFGFDIVWTSGRAVVVEGGTNFPNPVWSPLQTNRFANDSFYFGDAQWTNYQTRFYRVRSP